MTKHIEDDRSAVIFYRSLLAIAAAVAVGLVVCAVVAVRRVVG